MKEKRKIEIEFRYYETPQGFPLIALMGKRWEIPYGEDPVHFHNYLEIGICRYGEGMMHLGKEEVPYHDGTITVIPKEFPHCTRPVNNDVQKWEYLFVDSEIFLKKVYTEKPDFVNRLLKRLHSRMFLVSSEQQPEMAAILDVILKEMEQKREFYKETVQGMLLALLLKIVELNDQENTPEKNWMQQTNFESIVEVLRYIEQHYGEEIRINQLATQVNMSEAHFRRVFEEYMNVTPGEYINFIRIEKACDLMRKSDIKIQDVGFKVGFPVLTTFSRNFKRVTGVTPQQWKKKLKEEGNVLMDYKVSVLKGW